MGELRRTSCAGFAFGLLALISLFGPARLICPSNGRLGATVVVVDQPLIAGIVLLASRCRIAVGTQRPVSARPCPDGQGAPHALPLWPFTSVKRTASG